MLLILPIVKVREGAFDLAMSDVRFSPSKIYLLYQIHKTMHKVTMPRKINFI